MLLNGIRCQSFLAGAQGAATRTGMSLITKASDGGWLRRATALPASTPSSIQELSPSRLGVWPSRQRNMRCRDLDSFALLSPLAAWPRARGSDKLPIINAIVPGRPPSASALSQHKAASPGRALGAVLLPATTPQVQAGLLPGGILRGNGCVLRCRFWCRRHRGLSLDLIATHEVAGGNNARCEGHREQDPPLGCPAGIPTVPTRMLSGCIRRALLAGTAF